MILVQIDSGGATLVWIEVEKCDWWREIVLEDRICVILHFDLVNQLWICLEEAIISHVKNSPETGLEHN